VTTESRHRAAERWLSNALQQCIEKLNSPTLTNAEILKAVYAEVKLAEPWLQELLPPERIMRALQVHVDIKMMKPIQKVLLTLETGED
jgi:hypothetical protein